MTITVLSSRRGTAIRARRRGTKKGATASGGTCPGALREWSRRCRLSLSRRWGGGVSFTSPRPLNLFGSGPPAQHPSDVARTWRGCLRDRPPGAGRAGLQGPFPMGCPGTGRGRPATGGDGGCPEVGQGGKQQSGWRIRHLGARYQPPQGGLARMLRLPTALLLLISVGGGRVSLSIWYVFQRGPASELSGRKVPRGRCPRGGSLTRFPAMFCTGELI